MRSSIPSIPNAIIQPIIDQALHEDLGPAGDLTSQACIPDNEVLKAAILARNAGVIAGSIIATQVMATVDPSITFRHHIPDASLVEPDDVIIVVEGPARSILMAERVALNFMGHLSGIATATAGLVKEVAETKAKIVCTRKTTPGLRALEKYAVRCGGGYNHRFGLYDAVMIKDNHIAASGDITQALKTAKNAVGHTVKVEIEVDTLAQLEEVLVEGADIILLDNMQLEDLRKAVHMAKGQAILEASGNVTIKTVKAIAETGVDVISSGWITHSAPTLDLGLDIL